MFFLLHSPTSTMAEELDAIALLIEELKNDEQEVWCVS
jgi:hypothetical protein